jgi:hypothetical protein
MRAAVALGCRGGGLASADVEAQALAALGRSAIAPT